MIIMMLTALNGFNILWTSLYYRELSIRLERQAQIQEIISQIQYENTTIFNYSRSGNPDYLVDRGLLTEQSFMILNRLQAAFGVRSESWYRLSDIIHMRESYLDTQESLVRDTKNGIQTIYLRARGDELVRLTEYITNELQKVAASSMGELSEFYATFTLRITRMSTISLILLALTVLLAGYSSRRFVLSVSRPIHLLATRLVRFGEGDLETRVGDIGGRDEITILAQSFDRMGDRIRNLIEDIREKAQLEQQLIEQDAARDEAERLLKEAELAHLHAQINPHFLFNTLNILSSLSVMEHAPKTGKIVSDLSDLLRYSLRTGGNLVRLSDEIAVVESYMSIQQHRFGDKITFKRCIDTDIEQIKIPGMVLQPLAENAIKHGLEPIERKGTLTLSIRRKPTEIEIRLEDDGVGISEKALSLVNDANHKSKSLGIRNVKRRLSIYFSRDVLEIERGTTTGTTCRILIPGDYS